MEKSIWIIGNERKEIIEAQRAINSTGSMRAVCMLSFAAIEKTVQSQKDGMESRITTPSLIILDYEMSVEEDFLSLSYLKKQESIAGVPLFFMTRERSGEIDEICYRKGAMVVLRKPFSQSGILRVERVAWQYEVTKNYGKMLQRQAGDLQAAKEIVRLNEQLKARNELLYQIFGRYFSDSVVEVIMEHPESAAIGGERRELTIMMSDLRGFTSLSEELESDALTSLLNFYFSQMVDAITKYHGTVIEFLGDGILAVFGAPFASEYQAEDAVAAAITMQNLMGDVNKFCVRHGYPLLEMGIGIHQGEAFIGNVGSEKMMRYNVLGRSVNECSRIESSSVGGQVLISKECLDVMKVPVEVHNRMEIVAKGLQEPVVVSEVIGLGGDYQLRIANVEFDVMVPVKEWVLFNVFPIEEKLIKDESVTGKLIEFSFKRAVIELEDFQAELHTYSDVEIFAAGKDGRALFTGVYAKVVERHFNLVTLHFTHVSKSFQSFSDGIYEEIKKTKDKL